MNLLRKPDRATSKWHDITPESAGWTHVGFTLYRLGDAETIKEHTGANEAMLVVVEGKVRVGAGDRDFGILGDRMHVFEKRSPHAVYLPAETAWTAESLSECTLAVCRAPGGRTGREASIAGPDGVTFMERGKGANRREIFNIAMEDRDIADSLLVTEVFTPQGHWSSYPPHRHDVDDYPNVTYLEETYYHRLNPRQGFGFQRVFTDDRSLDETMTVEDHDVVLVPRGHHPCGTPFGYEMYYLNVMAGPIRKWRFANHPDHSWLYDFDPETRHEHSAS